jgi:hypothetical protein
MSFIKGLWWASKNDPSINLHQIYGEISYHIGMAILIPIIPIASNKRDKAAAFFIDAANHFKYPCADNWVRRNQASAGQQPQVILKF